jgi:hypothetical protein
LVIVTILVTIIIRRGDTQEQGDGFVLGVRLSQGR